MRRLALAEWKSQHDALMLAGKTLEASKLRWHVRARSAADGEPAPEWAIRQHTQPRQALPPRQPPSLAEYERRHVAHVSAGMFSKAGTLRHKARAFCKVKGLPVPQWAILTPDRGPQPASLGRRTEQHANLVAAGKHDHAAKLRLSTRSYCAETGQAVPEWAALQRARAESKPAPVTPGRLLELPQALQEWRDASNDRSVSVDSSGAVTLMRQTPKGPMTATFRDATAAVESPAKWQRARLELPRAQPLELPRALREWRAGSGDRAVSISIDGTVTLLRGAYTGKVKATFPSLDAAAAAVEPAIDWQPLHTTPTSWAHHAVRGAKAARPGCAAPPQRH